ncbi:hypothetical protein BG011_003367, partial [Mortierella polycephala]
MPYLLVLDSLFANGQLQGRRDAVRNPAQLLNIEGNEYRLAAVLYGGGNHFRSITMIAGSSMFYDGNAKRKMRWLNRSEYKVPEGCFVNQVWYLNKTRSSLVSAVSFADELYSDSQEEEEAAPHSDEHKESDPQQPKDHSRPITEPVTELPQTDDTDEEAPQLQ